ncbi:hypothetical protein Kpol_1055p67 [Vanderwaltozyma polyspora DSM 70294]|uniref:Uncharacterized protein n=1 Tax=Vanderwaltozyma polyspora (strain ATCC 22028 / DSM 70294 / BCRC 21397 / CBS 2163 / NBRC 10782 / NRRL Y-8283 / UCD 57-17) TaxID=436907 RepID=A7TGE0_VANPO|nr:uncharacterized protein Kpol_1055p67 [Vanderwaltozyma polyspora DSM 70294]EDO18710.1 hypothetical protein Kpol_1055p67 [Vanderwaltozyma polyspora DSM 70294]
MTIYSADEVYRQNQSQIYNLQETILNSNKTAHMQQLKNKSNAVTKENNTKRSSMNYSIVDSTSVLKFVEGNYSSQRKNLGHLCYDPFKTGHFQKNIHNFIELPYPYNHQDLSLPKPFLPELGNDSINSLITIKISYEDLCLNENSIQERPRFLNNEIWGCQIYSDDSDPVLALRHCGFLAGHFPNSNNIHNNSNNVNSIAKRTPGNLSNNDSVHGILPPDDTPFDIELTIIMLPCLQYYPSVSQYGINSRQWGSPNEILMNNQEQDDSFFNFQSQITAPHDGLSYAIYDINVITRDVTTKNINSSPDNVDNLKTNW